MLLVLPESASTISIRYNVTADTYIRSDQPGTSFGTSTLILICETAVCGSEFIGYWIASDIPVSSFLNSTFYFYQSPAAAAGGTLFLNLTTASWNETLTWNTKPAVDNAFSDSGAYLINEGWYSFNVTNVTRGWLNGTQTNYGFNITSSGGGQFKGASKENADVSRKGYLIINYSDPTLVSPTNGSTQYYNYPPQTTNINFTWITGSAASQIQVAKDINFNLISVDTIVSTDYSVQSLQGTQLYYWKVRTYNSTSGTYGSWSDTFNFTLQANNTAASGSVQGVVYELISGAQTAVNGASVFIYNTTWSSTQVTGSNGYYLFQNIGNGTYYIQASKKDYQDSALQIVNVTGNVVTQDILIKPTEPAWFEPDKHYVTFKGRYLYCILDCDVDGLTITAYKSGEVTAYKTGVTDSSGTVSFLLFKEQLYRVTAVNASAGISQEMTIYPKDTEYIFLVTNTDRAWTEDVIQEKDAISVDVSKSIINSTYANITVNFTDALAGTTLLTVYVNQSNGTSAETIIASWSNAGAANHTFTIANYSGEMYKVHIVATHSTYGTIDYTYGVAFEKSGMGITGISDVVWLWFAIGIMFFTAAVFTASTAEKGFIIVCAEGWIFFFMGMFAAINTAQMAISLSVASIISILAYIRSSQNKEGYS